LIFLCEGRDRGFSLEMFYSEAGFAKGLVVRDSISFGGVAVR
jgi:hypothetical protein